MGLITYRGPGQDHPSLRQRFPDAIQDLDMYKPGMLPPVDKFDADDCRAFELELMADHHNCTIN
jgi:hypothetical protein